MDLTHKKLRWTLLPQKPLKEVVKVLNWGAEKYSDWNWKTIPNRKKVFIEAALRHLMGYLEKDMDPTMKDEESGHHPIAHCITDLLFVLDKDIELKEKLEFNEQE